MRLLLAGIDFSFSWAWHPASELGISYIYSVWLDPSIVSVEKIDHAALFEVHREATVKVIRKALAGEPTIEWLLENQSQVTHSFHELGLAGEL
jgi:5,6,7,8-tetrahydromethanopterin hydro-lyase